MKKYKVLRCENGVYYSPFQDFKYGKLSDFIGKEFVCEDFDESDKECSKGFYATDIEGIIYSNLANNKVVFEVEMSGKSNIFNQYKQRFEKQKFVRLVPMEEVKQLVKEQSDKMDWDLYHALFPVDPRFIEHVEVTEQDIQNLKLWYSVGGSVGGSVWYSVRYSVRDSVGDSVGASVWDSVWDSVRDSVWYSVGDSVGAYMSSLFPNIKKWKYIDHEEGINPFQSAVDLWHRGLVPSFDGKTWRLHAGKDMKVVFEISKEDLIKK